MKNKEIVDVYWNMCQYTLPDQRRVCDYELFGKVINDFIQKIDDMKKNKHGGARKGSGAKRKPDHLKKEASKPVRVPLSKVDAVYEYIRTGKITTIHPMP